MSAADPRRARALDDLHRLMSAANRAGYIWMSRRWPGDDDAIALVSRLQYSARPRVSTRSPTDRASDAARIAARLADALDALALDCDALDRDQRVEIHAVAVEVRAAAAAAAAP